VARRHGGGKKTTVGIGSVVGEEEERGMEEREREREREGRSQIATLCNVTSAARKGEGRRSKRERERARERDGGRIKEEG